MKNVFRIDVNGPPGMRLGMASLIRAALTRDYHTTGFHNFSSSVGFEATARERDPVMEAQKAECLPDWAEAYKPDGKLEVNRQLCTRDGRRAGNAYITGIAGSIPALVLIVIYEVTTDAGNQLRMTGDEIDEIFYIGDYIARRETIPGLRAINNGEERNC